MTIRTIAWYASDEVYDALRDENRAEWARKALSMYMDTETSDSSIVEMLPEGSIPRKGRKVIMDAGDDLYAKLRKLSEETEEPMYSITTKAVMYRLLFEDGADKTFTIRLSEEEVRRLRMSGRTIADSIHAIIAEVSE